MKEPTGHTALRFIETLGTYTSHVSKYDALSDLSELIAQNEYLLDALMLIERSEVCIELVDAERIALRALEGKKLP